MCLAVVITEGFKLSREHAFNGFQKNRDGAGFAYIEDNKVIIRKGFFEFNAFWDAFNEIQEQNNQAKLVHFRIANCGAVTHANCHPWQLNEHSALIHNGLFSEFTKESDRISDTGLYVEKVLLPIFKKYKFPLPNEGLTWLIQKGTSGNKVAILCSNGHWAVFSPSGWEKEDGIWFSNTGYKSVIYSLPYRITQSEKKRDWYHASSRNKVPRKRNHKWRLCGEIFPLSSEQINKLTHTKRKKMRQLEIEGIVEKVWDEDINNFTKSVKKSLKDLKELHGIEFEGNKKDPSYVDFWMNANHSSIYRRSDLEPQNYEI